MKEPIAEPAETLNQKCLAMVYILLKFRFVLIVISLRNKLQGGLITLLIKNGQPLCMHYYSVFALFCDPCMIRDNRFHDEGCQNRDDIVILHSVLSSPYFVILALSETIDERCLAMVHAHSILALFCDPCCRSQKHVVFCSNRDNRLFIMNDARSWYMLTLLNFRFFFL